MYFAGYVRTSAAIVWAKYISDPNFYRRFGSTSTYIQSASSTGCAL